MKLPEAAILAVLCSSVLCAYEGERTDLAPTCCMGYTSRKIPRQLLVAYFKTSGQCSQNGVVFLTKKGRNICANPSDAWVQEYMNNMKQIRQAVQGVTFPTDSRDAD